ncbi:VWA domain-containing protein [Shewanella yunxiaonensis]|uniref:VWA domain-containing protein n=1 Tax=Shewanella yunxiaonensis TaxID=2829809 RepID=A0ABX7YQ53_9GAMM|nr:MULTISPECIES: VWA domain-containing protein [Shewanella]MDF0533609.1 VWA domain-containing protein [Shewanella sp. A32]QUN04643.1 VWA domain-containing protein [Shewanella yunxiaonensis]
MLTLAWPWLLILLPLPLIIRFQPLTTAGGQLQMPGIQQYDVTEASNKTKRHWVLWLLWLLLILALARPQWLGDPIELPTQGRDLMVAVDLSGSMQIEDMVLNGKTVDRFSVIQKVVSDFIDRRAGDRIGLILFADAAYLQAPLTLDRRSVAQYLKEAQIGLVGKQTAIGDAIALAVKRFSQLDKSNRVLVLLTDGSNNAGSIDPDEAAAIAAKSGVTIYTIGVGADVMEQRTLFGVQRVNPSADLDEDQLKRIADVTHGKYFRARNPKELEQIYHDIDQLQPVSRNPQTYRPQSELFYWPLGLAVLFSLLFSISSVLSSRSVVSGRSS